MRRLLVLALLALATGPLAAGEIYRHVDKNGNTVFTDQPPEHVDAQAVELAPLNTVPAARAPRPAREEKAAVKGYQRLVLNGVRDGDELRNPDGPVTLSAYPDVPLLAGHSLVLFHNGQEVGGGAGSYVINDIERGTHTFAAEIRDASGVALIRSAPATIQVFRNHRPPAPAKAH